MMQKTLSALLIVAAAAAVTGAAAAAVTGAAVAAGNPVVPEMHTGLTNRPPKNFVVSPSADQIDASNVIGADIKTPTGTTTAKIADIILDRRLGTAATAIIAPAGGEPFDQGKKSAIAWSSLQFEPRPTPHFVTRLDRNALLAGAALVEKSTSGSSYIDVKKVLLGKEVVGPNGAAIGHVQNLVLTFGTGRVVALVVSTGGFITFGGANNHAVAWDAAKPQTGENGGPVRVALTKAQIDTAPVTATIAPAPIAPEPGFHNVQVRRDSTGNISGTKIPAPQDQR